MLKIRDLKPGNQVMLDQTTKATVLSVSFDGTNHIALTVKGGYVARALRVSFIDHEPISAHPDQDIRLA